MFRFHVEAWTDTLYTTGLHNSWKERKLKSFQSLSISLGTFVTSATKLQFDFSFSTLPLSFILCQLFQPLLPFLSYEVFAPKHLSLEEGSDFHFVLSLFVSSTVMSGWLRVLNQFLVLVSGVKPIPDCRQHDPQLFTLVFSSNLK